MTNVFIIPGTWAYDGEAAGEYYYPGSELDKYFQQNDLQIATVEGEIFVWATALTGANPFRYFGFKDKHVAWKAAAKNLKFFLKDVPYEDRNLILHSHGGQVGAYALADGLKVRSMVTLMTPVRKDMYDVYEAAAGNSSWWCHVHSGWSDWTQLFGSLFDGHIGIHREMPPFTADKNIHVPKVGHSKLLRSPAHYPLWEQYDLFSHLR